MEPIVHFIGIGAQKAGSSWITQCLDEHPDICTPYVPGASARSSKYENKHKKETHFFDRDIEKGTDLYSSYFAHCKNDAVRGEWTPKYISDPSVPPRIKKVVPNVKILACLRNPIDRAFSHYRYKIQKKGIQKSFKDVYDNHEDMLERGLYATHLKQFRELFPEENIWIGWYDEATQDSESFIQSLYDFLEVDASFRPPSLRTMVNEGSHRELQILDVERKELIDFYSSDIKNLEVLTGKDLRHWIYEN